METINQFISQIPEFWSGVIASIVGGIFLTIFYYLLRISFASSKQREEKNALFKADIENKMKGNDLDKSHAALHLIFQTLKWLFLGNLLWIASEFSQLFRYFGEEVTMVVFFAFKISALLCFLTGVQWVYFYVNKSSLMPNKSLK